jgi:hypothetical protein
MELEIRELLNTGQINKPARAVEAENGQLLLAALKHLRQLTIGVPVPGAE